MDEGITVGDMTDKVSWANHGWPVEPDLVMRRLRHWTLAGLLPTIGESRSGTGKHRRYAPSAVLVAAVLNSLSEANHPIGLLTTVAKYVVSLANGEEPLGSGQHLWKAALDGKEPIFLMIFGSWQTPGQMPPASRYSITMTNREGMRDFPTMYHGGAWVNLTFLFRNLATPRNQPTP